jgi:hypothetical protein
MAGVIPRRPICRNVDERRLPASGMQSKMSAMIGGCDGPNRASTSRTPTISSLSSRLGIGIASVHLDRIESRRLWMDHAHGRRPRGAWDLDYGPTL